MKDRRNREPSSQHDLSSSITLLNRARQGDAHSLELLYSRYLPRLARWAHGRLPARSRSLLETGDIVLETLGSFLRRMPDFEPRHDGALMAYLCRALDNRIRKAYRDSGRRPELVSAGLEKAVAADRSPFELCVDEDVRARYARALDRLSEDERAAVTMKVELAFGPREIARALGKSSPDAARMYTQRAIRKLAREMSHEG